MGRLNAIYTRTNAICVSSNPILENITYKGIRVTNGGMVSPIIKYENNRFFALNRILLIAKAAMELNITTKTRATHVTNALFFS